jgi:uncharacterized membrane protein YhhN
MRFETKGTRIINFENIALSMQSDKLLTSNISHLKGHISYLMSHISYLK